MKRPPVDIQQVVTAQFLGKLSFLNKFIRYWGTEVVEGEEVMRGRNWYYGVADTTNAHKVAKLLGFYNDIANTKMKGVSSAWLYLNQANSDIPDLSNVLLANYFNKVPSEARVVNTTTGNRLVNTIRTTVHIYSHRGGKVTNIASPITDQSSLIAELRAEYQYMFDTHTITSNAPSDGYLDTLTRYALLDSGLEVNINKVTVSLRQHIVSASRSVTDLWEEYENSPATELYKTRRILVPTYSLEIDIIEPVLTDTSLVVTKSLSDRLLFTTLPSPRREDKYNEYLTFLQLNKAMYIGTVVIDPNVSVIYHPPVQPTNPSLWVLSSGRYYLKKSTLTSHLLKLDERISLIGKLMDADYSEKSRNWWEGLLLLIVVAVAIYYGNIAAGPKAAALIVAATAITYVAFALAIYAAIMDALGQETAAMSASKLNRTIAPTVKIASMILVINSIYNMAGTTAKKGAEEVVKNEGKHAVGSAAYDTAVAKLVDTQFTDMLMQGITDVAATEVKNVTFEKAIDVVNMVSELYQKNKLAELKDGIKSQQKELAELEEANEASKYSDLAKAFAASYTNQLGNDWSLYAFDRPYEPTGGTLHTGNIQATTVSAMWLADDMV